MGNIFFPGIQLKLIGIFAAVSLLILAVGIFALSGIEKITNASDIVTQREVPLVRSVQEALVAMIIGKEAVEAALFVEDFALIEQLKAHEADSQKLVLRFNMFISAIMWGSESEAFASSSEGAILAEWENEGLKGTLVVEQASVKQAQLAGRANIYYGGFVNHTQKSIGAHKEFLRLESQGQTQEAQGMRQESRREREQADKFFGLTVGVLEEMVEISNATTDGAIKDIENTQNTVFFFVLLASLGGFILALFISGIFTSRVITRPLASLADAARRISEGDLEQKVEVTSKDEIGQLALAFNEMTAKLGKSYVDLEKKVKERTKELEERVQELDKTAKLLVRRDFEFLQTNEFLREMDEAKSRFVSIAAHQLRTPLAGVKWTMQMLLSGDFGKLAKDQKNVLQEAYGTLQRLIALVRDLLSVARIEEGRTLYKFSPVQMEEVCTNVFDESVVAAESKGITLKLILPKDPLPKVSGDFSNLIMVLQNIVDNAITYTEKGGLVEVGTRRHAPGSKRVQVFVRDTGIGIPRSQQTLIGQKFFRGDNVVRKQVYGSGLGLYIVKRVLEKHGGKLEFNSQEGKGSTFFFTLPFLEE